MTILEWTKPGIFIEGLDQDASRRLSRQIHSLEDAVVEANVTLNMFDQAAALDRTMERPDAEFEARCKISRDVQAELFPDGIMPLGMMGNSAFEEFKKRKTIVDANVRHRMWQAGFLPRTFISKPRFILAKAFIHALDLFDRSLGEIANDPSSPNGIKAIHEGFCKSFPDLREVRNSIQHAEERSKGESFRKKIDLKKIESSKVPIDGIAIVIAALNGNSFGMTMANGKYGTIEVSVQTINVLKIALLDVYSAFAWKGGECVYPI